jgi:hypothetical protein
MKYTNSCCQELAKHLEEDVYIQYISKFREVSIDINGSSARQVITFCPWCGNKLPSSLRDRWFEEGKNLISIPVEFDTDIWWKKRNIE